MKPCTDEELRKMRDAVFAGVAQSDESWEAVKSKWRNDEAWLTEQYNRLNRSDPPGKRDWPKGVL